MGKWFIDKNFRKSKEIIESLQIDINAKNLLDNSIEFNGNNVQLEVNCEKITAIEEFCGNYQDY